MQKRRPVMLVVLDGWGCREETADNAVRQARTPAFDRLWSAGPHAFLRTSGRDTPPHSAAEYVKNFTAALPPKVMLATVDGRYYAMDRDKRWERVAKAYAAMVEGEGPRFADAQAAIADAYAHELYDEFILP